MNRPLVMGIINVDDDSFYAASRHTEPDDVVETAQKMVLAGASIIDIGGQSTRPGSLQYTADEEAERVIPAIECVHKALPQAIISVDTYYSAVARQAVQVGASIINDVSGGSLDDDMFPTVADLRVPYILMHMQGTPVNMQLNPQYEDVTREVLDYFIQKLAVLRSMSIHDIIIDPGFGFGKTIQHNFTLLKNLETFKILECPLLVGISRKSTIYKTLGTTADHALNGTTVLNTIGLLNGAQILRVHDVQEAVEAVKLVEQYRGKSK
ncbi:MAG: dihydropteroate synthase [Niabella sp.]